MPWTGSAPNQTFQRSDGTRNGTQVWQEAEADGVDIVSTDHDTHDQDLGSAINATLKKDGGNQPSANLPMGAFRHLNVGDATAINQYLTVNGAINGTHRYVSIVGGTGDAITLTTGWAMTAYSAGQQFSFIVGTVNSGATTVNVNGLGAKAVVRLDGTALQAGDLYLGALALIEYDGTSFQLINRRVVEGSGSGGAMTGAEIEAALNVHLGNEDWQDIATTQIIPAVDADGRVTVPPTSNHVSGAKFGMAATADGRVLAWGDVGAFAFNPVGDAYGAFELSLPWDPATVSVEKIYVGLNYALVLTDEATENLYAIGGNDDGQCGQGNTTAQTQLIKVTGLTGVHIDSVVNEASRGNTEKFWFALTSTGAVYSCGYSGAQHVQGYNSTSDLTTPRLMTQSDGTTPLADIVEISCDTAYAPVWARDSSNRAWRWGAGTSGAHGDNSTTAITWPTLLETSPGSGTARTDIAQVVTTGSAVATGRAASWIRTTAGKIECAGNQLYGIGDAATLANTNATTFQTAAGAIDALTVSALYAGGGEYYNCVAITSTGQGYLVGYVASYGLLGDGGTTNLNTFTIFFGLPTSFAGNLTSAAIAGGNSYTAIYLEATISGVKTLASIGYDGYYATAKNVAGTAAANQTWGAVQGAWGTLASWGVFGGNQEYGLWTLNSDGELRYCGRNDQGQAGMRHAPGVMASIPILQRVDLGVPRLLKPPVNRGAYSAVVEYSKQDVVTQSGSSWIYVNETAGSGNAPPTLPTTSNSYWQLLAAKGDTGITTDLANDVNGNAYSIFGVTNTYNDQTGTTYTLQATDTGNVLTFDNAADVTVTVPATLPVGFSCTVIQLGAGQVIFTGGATINHVQGHDRTFGQYAMAILAVYANSGGSAAVACLSGATDN
jgi:hypothetical protein